MHPVQGTSESSLWSSLCKESWEIFSEQEMLGQVSFLQCAGKVVLETTYSNCAEYVCSRKVNKLNCKINVISLKTPEHPFQSVV